MKTIIYYFTGTGNSLQVANELSANLGDCRVSRILADSIPNTDADALGFVFPVYLWGMPRVVERFLTQLPVAMEDKYLFVVATYKSQPGAVIEQTARILRRTRNRLCAGFTIEMPGNNIIYYEIEPEAVQKRKIEACHKRVKEIAAIVRQREAHLSHGAPLQKLLFTGFLHGVLTGQFEKSDKNFTVSNDCTHCGICEKVCPMGNIVLNDAGPSWRHHCQQCTACLNACPTAAIQYGKTTIGKRRYINEACAVRGLMEKHNL